MKKAALLLSMALLLGSFSTQIIAKTPEKVTVKKAMMLKMTVKDETGALVYQQYSRSHKDLQFDFEHMPSGKYVIEVSQGKKMINKTEITNASQKYSREDYIRYRVTDVNGDVVYAKAFLPGSTTNFNLEALPAGNYMVEVFHLNSLLNKTIIRI